MRSKQSKFRNDPHLKAWGAPNRIAPVEVLESRQLFSAGNLDAGFGNATSALVADKGAIAAAWPKGDVITWGAGRTNNYFAVLHRFSASGELDLKYGHNGTVTVPNVSSGAMLATPDGGVIFASVWDQTRSIVIRITRNGRIVRSFGDKGTASVSIGIVAAALQNDGRIVLWGTSLTDPSQLQVTRLLSNGKIDDTFGASGSTTVSFPDLGQGTVPQSVSILANGGILAFANQQNLDSGFVDQERDVVVRLTPAGALDSHFADGGLDLLPAISPNNVPVNASATVESDGSFLVTYDGSLVYDQPGPGTVPVRVYHFERDGSLDGNFGTTGYTDIPNAPIGYEASSIPNEGACEALVDPDGSITVIGSDEQSTFLMRLNADGSIDSSFGGTGSNAAGIAGGLEGIAISSFEQPDGKIVVLTNNVPVTGAPYAGNPPSATDYALIRYSTDGTVDTSFGYNGMTIDPFGINGPINGLASEKNKEIVESGSEAPPVSSSPTDASLVKYRADGTLDTSFGDDGRLFAAIGSDASFGDILIGGNGNIYALATSTDAAGDSSTYSISCYSAGGRLVKGFANRGQLSLSGTVTGMAMQKDGDIVVASAGATGGFGTVRRYLPNGRVDRRFSTTGLSDAQQNAAPGGIVCEADGSLVVAVVGGLVKLSSSGLFDSSFGVNGVAPPSPIFVFGESLSGLALAPNGDIYSFDQFSLQRYLPNGMLDTTFGSGGAVDPNSIPNAGPGFGSICVLKDGEVLAGTEDSTVACLSPNGALDTTINGNGEIALTVIQFGDIPAMVVQPDQKVVVAVDDPEALTRTPPQLDAAGKLNRILGK